MYIVVMTNLLRNTLFSFDRAISVLVYNWTVKYFISSGTCGKVRKSLECLRKTYKVAIEALVFDGDGGLAILVPVRVESIPCAVTNTRECGFSESKDVSTNKLTVIPHQ